MFWSGIVENVAFHDAPIFDFMIVSKVIKDKVSSNAPS